MSDVIRMDPHANKPHFNLFALCLKCQARWIATVMADVSVFKLECPRCGEFDSFASIVTHDYAQAALDEMEKKT